MEKLTRVRFTNLDKVMYPELGVTKAQIIEHYIKVAPRMLFFLRDRITVMTRFPDGIKGEGFYEKNVPRGAPDWVETFKRYSETSGREIKYVICNDLETLLWLANLASLEIHVTLSKAETYGKPNLVLFDIDPEPPAGIEEAGEIALSLKEKLESLGFKSFVKTTGKKGLHVLLPIVNDYSFTQTREFVHQFGRHLSRENPRVVSERSRSQEPGKVYIDYLQNSRGRTMICPYSLRAEEGATVSTPLEWRELKGLNPKKLNVFSVSKIRKDPWDGFWEEKQRLEVG